MDGTITGSQMRQIGLPWSERLVRRTLIGVGSAVLAARLALQFGVACMSNGGTHHAHAAHGSGMHARACYVLLHSHLEGWADPSVCVLRKATHKTFYVTL